MKAALSRWGTALIPGFIKNSGQVNYYIFKQAFITFLVFTLSMTCIFWLSQSLRFIDMIVNRGLSMWMFIKFTSLMIPSLIHLILPIALFFSVLFVYNRLLLDQELTVLRSCGQSPRQMAKPAMMLVVLVIGFSYFSGAYLMPASYRNFKDLQADIRDNYASTLLQEGVFTEISDNVTVFIRERQRDGELAGILVYDTREPGKQITILADHGRLIKTPQGPSVAVENGNRQEMNKKSGKLNTLYFDEYTIDLRSYNEDGGPRWREPRERYLYELVGSSSNITDQINRLRLYAEFHDRILTPLKGILFTNIALLVMLFGEIPRRSTSNRILLGVGLVILGQAIIMSLTNLSTKSMLGVPFLYASVLLPLLLTWKLIYNDKDLVFLNYFQGFVNRFLEKTLPSRKEL